MDIKETLQIILQDRMSSWAIILSVYLLVTIVIRRFTFSQLRVSVKCLDRRIYKRAKRGYFKESLPGWILYLVSAAFLMAYWFSCCVPWLQKVPSLVFLAAVFLFFFLSLLSHIRSFFFATVHAFHEKLEKEEYERHRAEED